MLYNDVMKLTMIKVFVASANGYHDMISIYFSEYEPPSWTAKIKASFHRITTQFLSYTQEIYDPHISYPLPPSNNNHNQNTLKTQRNTSLTLVWQRTQ